jgi:hypothetical protein
LSEITAAKRRGEKGVSSKNKTKGREKAGKQAKRDVQRVDDGNRHGTLATGTLEDP